MIDKAIIQGCIKEDPKSQRMLFEHLAPKMFSTCMRYARHRMEAKDMLQDTFVKIFDNIKKYNGSGSFEGWVRKIVVNTALSYCQKISFSKEEIGIPNTFEQGFSTQILEELSEQELLQHIYQLPDGYRIIFNLFAIVRLRPQRNRWITSYSRKYFSLTAYSGKAFVASKNNRRIARIGILFRT